MPGYMFLLGPCIVCGNLFSYNAEWVPSIPVKGVREPVCGDCMARANAERVKAGRAPLEVHPDAYEAQEGP